MCRRIHFRYDDDLCVFQSVSMPNVTRPTSLNARVIQGI